jgi:hypothetical protein
LILIWDRRDVYLDSLGVVMAEQDYIDSVTSAQADYTAELLRRYDHGINEVPEAYLPFQSTVWLN